MAWRTARRQRGVRDVRVSFTAIQNVRLGHPTSRPSRSSRRRPRRGDARCRVRRHARLGYDGVQPVRRARTHYGGSADSSASSTPPHAQGLGVVLDVVYNHLGPTGNYLPRFGPYFTDHHPTPWGAAVNLDDVYSNDVRRFVIDNALSWLRDFHVDGLRPTPCTSSWTARPRICSKSSPTKSTHCPPHSADRCHRGRVGSQRRSARHGEGGRRLRTGGAVERRFPPCAARHAAPVSRRASTPISAAWRRSPKR